MRDWLRRRGFQDEVRHLSLGVSTRLRLLRLTALPDRLVGFDELDGGDNFNTAQLEVGMVQCGASFSPPSFPSSCSPVEHPLTPLSPLRRVTETTFLVEQSPRFCCFSAEQRTRRRSSQDAVGRREHRRRL